LPLPSHTSKGMSAGPIVGGVTGAIVLLGVIVALAFCYKRRRRGADDDTEVSPYRVSSSSSTSPALFGINRPRHTAEDSVARKDRGVQRAPGRRDEVRSPSPPATMATDPLLDELRRLREELTAERVRLEAPPSYDSHHS
jgi:hypothetical protein